MANNYNGLSVLLPIEDHLARADALIDQAVYWLYGLSDAVREIAVGKGRNKADTTHVGVLRYDCWHHEQG